MARRRPLREPTARRSGRRGFTLVECMLAITMFSILITAVYSVLRIGIKAERTGNATVGEMRRIRWLMDDMVRDVRNAVPAPGEDFAGEADRFALLTVVPSAPANGAVRLRRIRYWLVRTEDSDRVTVCRSSEDPFGTAADTTRHEFAVGRIAFAYERVAEDGERTWLPSWAEMTGMPTAVRLEVATDQAGDYGTEDERGLVLAVPVIADRMVANGGGQVR